MALSNWDTLALTIEGPSGGVFVSRLGVEVEIYKNWLYVHDPQAWREGGGFSKPTVAQVEEGEVTLQDVFIHAVRGPQDGVFAVVRSSCYGEDAAMVGCGVYGWGENPDSPITVVVDKDGVRGPDGSRYVLPPWVGVSPESKEFLRRHALEVLGSDHPLMARERWEGAVRFNQGDLYFAATAGAALQASSPGQAQEPLITQILSSETLPEA